jgi:hypothetical protein
MPVKEAREKIEVALRAIVAERRTAFQLLIIALLATHRRALPRGDR